MPCSLRFCVQYLLSGSSNDRRRPVRIRRTSQPHSYLVPHIPGDSAEPLGPNLGCQGTPNRILLHLSCIFWRMHRPSGNEELCHLDSPTMSAKHGQRKHDCNRVGCNRGHHHAHRPWRVHGNLPSRIACTRCRRPGDRRRSGWVHGMESHLLVLGHIQRCLSAAVAPFPARDATIDRRQRKPVAVGPRGQVSAVSLSEDHHDQEGSKICAETAFSDKTYRRDKAFPYPS